MLTLSPNSLKIMQAKYLKKNERGKVIETPKDCFHRVAEAVAKPEETPKLRKFWEEKFFEIMNNLEFLPGGRTLANAGTNYPQLANCFVLPLEDNIEEIFEVVKESSILKKFGGGVGFSFSKIRPKGDRLLGTSGSACGPVVLMKILDSASEIFMQQGTRRSGNMVVLSISHPDILDFITVKKDQNSLAQINYSLGITDSFMKAVEKDKSWNLINPRTGKVAARVKAKSLFEAATAMAWENGDPGMIFLDRINRDNPTPQLGPIEAVNLCGEQPLLPYEACNLGSINLTKFIKLSKKDVMLNSFQHLSSRHFGEPRRRQDKLRDSGIDSGQARMTKRILKQVQNDMVIDWDHLSDVVYIAVRFLDNVIDAGHYPIAKVDRVVKSNRKIGLGVMGWADFLIKLEIPYNSLEALKLAERVMKFFSTVAHETSRNLGKEKGSFTNFAGSTWQKKFKYKWMRNSTTTTIAPTGSISMVANVSSGIEPLFALSYYKEVMGGQRFFEKIQNNVIPAQAGIQAQRRHAEQVFGSGSPIRACPRPDRGSGMTALVTAHEISYDWHVKMQAAFQKYTDNAVSKTINLAHNATIEDVKAAFMLAWKLGCKGITVYRDQSRSEQVLNVGVHVIPAKALPVGRQAGIQTQHRHAELISASVSNKKRILNQVQNDDKNVCPACAKTLVREEGCWHCPSCGFSACEI